MDLSFSAEELAFRDEVRRFFKEEYPKDLLEKRSKGQVLSKDDIVRSQKALAAKGWAAMNWPVEHGGTGWTATQRYIYEEEAAAVDLQPLVPFGLSMVAPVIYTFGNDEQKKRFLPDILESNVWWCQGYSEPGAGSDLASLKTKAVRDGDHYVVTGTKTWTTLAQHADWIFCLVRTDGSGKKQEGISFLLIDMKSPGISVRPIITIDGGHEVNETHFEEVRVPAENLIGEEGKGWTYAKVLLTHERTGIAAVARSKRSLSKIKKFAAKQMNGGLPLLEDETFRRRISEIEIELMALEMTDLRTLAAVSLGGAPGPESSILKIKGTEIQQALTELAMEVSGYYAMPFIPESLEPGWNGDPIGPEEAVGTASKYFNMRKTSIYGGSNEIQKNIISKAVLRL
ncbi:MAG: acyl-CoA dehydrogenase family protein [Alphaproteobacteria bacterium]|nr:acyl-CoA dehydrogenase family protein [Alphaproteobacteria bacterium]